MLKLIEFCEVRGISQYKLAELIRMPRSTLHKRAHADWMAWYNHETGYLHMQSKSGAEYKYKVEL